MLHKIAKLMYWVIPLLLGLCPAFAGSGSSPEPAREKSREVVAHQTVTDVAKG